MHKQFLFGADVKIHTLDFHDAKIKIYEIGNGTKKVVALPGFPNSGLFYVAHQKLLKNLDLKIITFDIPGWIGYSQNSKALFKSKNRIFLYSQLLELIYKKLNLTDEPIFAYSFGGSILLRAIGLVNPKKIFFVSPVFSRSVNGNLKRINLLKFAKNLKLSKIFKIIFLSRLLFFSTTSLKKYLTNHEIKEFVRLVLKTNTNVLVDDTLELFSCELKDIFTRLEAKKYSIAYSKDETHYFIKNSKYIAENFSPDIVLELDGDHAKIVSNPNLDNLTTIYSWLIKE